MWFFGRKKRKWSPSAALLTDRGLVRAENQDSALSAPDHAFFCVADGMGGGQDGGVASRWICEALASVAEVTSGASVQERLDAVCTALNEVNARICAYKAEKGYTSMGSTVVVLVLGSVSEGRVGVLHVGDSRLYRLRKGKLECLTRDHTVGNELGRFAHEGSRQRALLQSRQNPLTHVLTRAVGTEFQVRPDIDFLDVRCGDRFLLCSDGVHDMVGEEELAPIMAAHQKPEGILEHLAEVVRKAGAEDNFTAVFVEVK